MTDVKEGSRGVKGSLAGSVVLLGFDAVINGTFTLSIFVCPMWFLVSFVKNVIERPGWRLALVRLAIPTFTLWLVWVNSNYQLTIARKNATRVVTVCEKYHGDNGKFVSNLDDLVPKYLRSVPVARHCIGPSRVFYYYYNFGHPMLVWQVVPPHHRRIYNFDTRRWSHLD